MQTKTLTLTTMAMLAFAANSILCRLALVNSDIDALSFTLIRLFSGSALLLGYVHLLQRNKSSDWISFLDWRSSLALFVYAIAFSFAYVALGAGTGALILFGAVQFTMLGWGYVHGDRFSAVQLGGFACSVVGLVYLLSPGANAPSLLGAVLMLSAGIAWGVYSLRGRGVDPVQASAANFVGSLPMIAGAMLLLWLWSPSAIRVDGQGAMYAIASGACASAIGYIIWYAALAKLRVSHAATVQLSVPVLAAIGGVLLLAESWSVRLILAGAAILGGIAVVLFGSGVKPNVYSRR